jgi:hypothetical protein
MQSPAERQSVNPLFAEMQAAIIIGFVLCMRACRMVGLMNEWEVCGEIDVPSRNLPGGNEENDENLH